MDGDVATQYDVAYAVEAGLPDAAFTSRTATQTPTRRVFMPSDFVSSASFRVRTEAQLTIDSEYS